MEPRAGDARCRREPSDRGHQRDLWSDATAGKSSVRQFVRWWIKKEGDEPLDWTLARICKWFGCSLEEAERTDIERCKQIMSMWSFAELSDRELANPKSVSKEQREFIIRMERLAKD